MEEVIISQKLSGGCILMISKFYGDKERYERDDSDEDDSYIANVMRIKNLYYNRTFSEKEVDSIIEGIMATRTLDSNRRRSLSGRLRTI